MGKRKGNMDDLQEKQIPEKPKVAKNGMSPIVMAGIIAGIVIVTVVIIFIGFSIFILPSINQGGHNSGKDSIESNEKSEDESKIKGESKFGNDLSFLTEEEKANIIFDVTGRITTNPKNDPSKFVVLDLGISFLPREEKDLLELKGEKANSKLWKMIMAETRHIINSSIRNLTIEDLESTPTDSLVKIFSKELDPIFTSKKILLTNVLIQEFIIQ